MLLQSLETPNYSWKNIKWYTKKYHRQSTKGHWGKKFNLLMKKNAEMKYALVHAQSTSMPQIKQNLMKIHENFTSVINFCWNGMAFSFLITVYVDMNLARAYKKLRVHKIQWLFFRRCSEMKVHQSKSQGKWLSILHIKI